MAPLRRRPPSRVVGHLHVGQIDAGHAVAAEFEDQRLFVVEAAVAGDGRQLVGLDRARLRWGGPDCSWS